MKIVSWNVNGLRSVLGYQPWCHSKNKHKRLQAMLEFFESDIICFQETKINRDKLSTDIATVNGYISFYSFCNTRNGYCGVSTYIRESETYLKPIKAQDGFTGMLNSNRLSKLITTKELLNILQQRFTESRLKTLDNEGRCLITQHTDFLLFNIYFPNAGASEERLNFKTDYHECIQIVIQYFITNKQNVILVGDLNAKYQMIDSCDPGEPHEFMERKSTQWFRSLVHDTDGLQMIDTLKYIHSDFSKLPKKPYTCWDTYTFARDSNYGTRIDYVLINHQMINQHVQIIDANVMQSIKGSDHCPVFCKCKITKQQDLVANKETQIPQLASRFMPEFSGKQTTLKSFFSATGAKNRKRKFIEMSQPTLTSSERVKKKQKLNNNSKRKPGNRKNKKDENQLTLAHFFTKGSSHDIIEKQARDTENINTIQKKGAKSKDILPKKQSSSEQWKVLFGKKKAIPRCSVHLEECILRTVAKHGVNRGRKFYCCRRGKGDIKDPNAQCGFFLWLDKQ